MRALAQKTLAGLLATVLLSCGGAASAAPPPHPGHHPGYHPGHHPGPQLFPSPLWHHLPVIYPVPRPIVVYRPAPAYSAPLDIVASNPVPVADIRIVNPAANRATLRFTLNGRVLRSLRAGYSVEINQAATIEFDRGGGAGRARYSLTDGTYQFTTVNGAWSLVRQDDQEADLAQVAEVAINPIPSN